MSPAGRQDSSTVTHIGGVADVSNNQGDDGATTTSLDHRHLFGLLVPHLAELDELGLRFCKALPDGLLRVPWEALLLD